MNYKLTLLQFFASRFLLINYNQNLGGLIIAVCGAGKTEMCFPLMQHTIGEKKIGFAIPRVDICFEIYERLCIEFDKDKIGIHTGKMKNNLQAKILVLTTNQCIKYTNYFDILIIDEVDAFPFDVDPKFYHGVQNTIKSNNIFYLTSTPSERLLKMNLPTFTIYKRWHNYPLPVPHLIHQKNYLKLSYKTKLLLRNWNRQQLIFISTISSGYKLSALLTKLNIDHQFTYSSDCDRQQKISLFKAGELTRLVTTTILERGMTFTDIDVFIIDSDNCFYNKAALVQIAGRARRKIEYQQGNVYFCYTNYTKTIRAAIKFIKENNSKIWKRRTKSSSSLIIYFRI